MEPALTMGQFSRRYRCWLRGFTTRRGSKRHRIRVAGGVEVERQRSRRALGDSGLGDVGEVHVLEATEDLDFFGFYSTDLEGFTGIGHSIEDCLYKARWGMADHAQTLRDQGLPVPASNPNPTIVIQNEPKLQPA